MLNFILCFDFFLNLSNPYRKLYQLRGHLKWVLDQQAHLLLEEKEQQFRLRVVSIQLRCVQFIVLECGGEEFR